MHWPDKISSCGKEHSRFQKIRRSGNRKKEMGLDRAHTMETIIKHYETGLVLDPPGETEKKKAEKYLATRPLGRHHADGNHLEPVRIKGTG